jgi:hypothetical protein
MLIARYRSLRIAPEAAYFVVARRREACQLAPSQHGGARSGASDNDGDGFSMFAPPICRRSWRNNAFPFRQLRRRRRQPGEYRSERSEQ